MFVANFEAILITTLNLVSHVNVTITHTHTHTHTHIYILKHLPHETIAIAKNVAYSFIVSKGIVNVRLNTFPLRQRIVHLLAVRPYKAADLLVRMNRDGVKYKDRKHITRTLRKVSTPQNKTFVLKHGLWNEVYEDWPFHTKLERQQCCRRQTRKLASSASDDSTSWTSGGYYR